MFVKEITKHWSFEPVNVRNVQDGNELTVKTMATNRSDIALCGVWHSLQLEQQFDSSTYFDKMCGTFLVPRPNRLNAASNIYLSFSEEVWLATLGTCIVIIVSLIIISKFKFNSNIDTHLRLHMSFLDLSGIALIQCIPQERYHTPIKCVMVR